MKQRLESKLLRVDSRIKEGYYSDVYFNRTRQILEADNHHPVLRMQYFQKNDNACLAGIDEAIGLLKETIGEDFKKLKVKALHDGDIVNANETVMFVEGDYTLFPHLETVMLGAMARRTKVASNVYNTVKEACEYTDKPVLFFPARFDIYQTQQGDGYAYDIALKALRKENCQGNGVSTDAQGEWFEEAGLGTMPHSLIAAYGGDTAKAALKFGKNIEPEVKRVVLVDYENDCVKTTLDVADAMLEKYIETDHDERYKLFGVRLDTSGTMVDESVKGMMGQFKPTGVNEQLVMNVYNALQEKGNQFDEASVERKFYHDVGIIVSGGFTPEKIMEFEEKNLPVMAYGVGSSMFKGSFDFTADVVSMKKDGRWIDNSKVGRKYNPNPRLEDVI